jgi:hypothetical protein
MYVNGLPLDVSLRKKSGDSELKNLFVCFILRSAELKLDKEMVIGRSLSARSSRGCRIFLGTKYQNWEKYTK